MDYFFSFTVVNYALKFSDFGIDGADRYFLEHPDQAFCKKSFHSILKLLPGEKTAPLRSGLKRVS